MAKSIMYRWRSRLTATLSGIALAGVASVASAGLITVDVSGVESNGPQGDPLNTTITVDLAAELGAASGTQVNVDGLGWDVTIEAFTPSWLSEASIAFDNSGGTTQLILAPGAGDDLPGVGTYSSGGIIDLSTVSPGLNFSLSDGVLVLEFFDSFDDGLDPEAIWRSGTLTIEAFAADVDVPAPAAIVLLATGLFGVALRRRRRNV